MKFIFIVFVNDGMLQTSATVREFMEGVLAMREGNLARNYEVENKRGSDSNESALMNQYREAKENTDILALIKNVESGNFKANEKVILGAVSTDLAERIKDLTGIDVNNFKIAIEARQIDHILKDHGEKGKTDKSMSNPSDIAKMEYAIYNYDSLIPAGKTQAYTHMVNGRNRTADTVLYEKDIGDKSYYVVQAVPDTKAKTLFIVTAFIGKKGYKKEASQLINAKSLDVTAKTGSANTSNGIVSQPDGVVNRNGENISEEMKQSRYDEATQVEINESMTMEQAKQMIQRAFVIGGIKEWYDGEYKNGDEWAKAQGADEVAMYIDNEYQLQELYVNKIPGILDDKFFTADVVEAYLNGTLTGKVKKKAEKLDLGKSVKVADSRFYAPQAIEKAKALYEIANQRLNDDNRAVVNNARAKILLYAHNKGAAETLGISQSDLNKKLRSWSNYSNRARETSIKINAGIEESNRWTGIENVVYINKARVSADEVARMVKAIEGKSDAFQNKYIARTMLALDTHIDWSWLTFKFDSKQGVNDAMIGGSGRANGYYRDSERLIHAIPDSPNTIAHEMGHALDHQWARDLGFGNTSLTEAYRNTDRVSGDVKIWFDQFKAFSDSLAESASLYSAYTMDVQEAFARFVAKFVEWTEIVSTGRSSGYETSYYNDKFTTAQFVEFARILQGKAVLDANGLTKNKVTEADVMRQARKSTMSNSIFTEEEMLKIRRDVVKHFNLKGINGFEQVQRGVLNTLKENGFFESNNERKVVIRENGMEVTINRGSIEETFGSGNKYESVPATFKILKLATIEQIPNIIENATVDFENEKNKYNNGKNKAFTYLSGTATIDGKSVSVRVTLKISKEKNRFWVHYVDVIKNTDDIFGLGANNASPTDSKLSSAEDSIPQNQQMSSDFDKNSSDELSQKRISTPDPSTILKDVIRNKVGVRVCVT